MSDKLSRSVTLKKEDIQNACFKTLVAIFALSYLCSSSALANTQSGTYKITKADDIEWGYLNPARGDKSPGAADLWGDRTKDVATGMLVRFDKGFSSPSHIHNISYRGVVIEGLLHNDDPNAEYDWMPTGSYWTQPAGDVHITAANDRDNLIYLEIDSGPYLVKPTKEAFQNGEHSLNMHVNNYVWLTEKEREHIKAGKVKVTSLWQKEDINTSADILELPANFTGKLSVKDGDLKVVVIKGSVTYSNAQQSEENLTAGSFLSSTGKFTHELQTEETTWLYVRNSGEYKVLK